MALQFLWTFGLACLDLHALKSKKNLQSPVLLSLFVVGDWVSMSRTEFISKHIHACSCLTDSLSIANIHVQVEFSATLEVF